MNTYYIDGYRIGAHSKSAANLAARELAAANAPRDSGDFFGPLPEPVKRREQRAALPEYYCGLCMDTVPSLCASNCAARRVKRATRELVPPFAQTKTESPEET